MAKKRRYNYGEDFLRKQWKKYKNNTTKLQRRGMLISDFEDFKDVYKTYRMTTGENTKVTERMIFEAKNPNISYNFFEGQKKVWKLENSKNYIPKKQSEFIRKNVTWEDVRELLDRIDPTTNTSIYEDMKNTLGIEKGLTKQPQEWEDLKNYISYYYFGSEI